MAKGKKSNVLAHSSADVGLDASPSHAPARSSELYASPSPQGSYYECAQPRPWDSPYPPASDLPPLPLDNKSHISLSSDTEMDVGAFNLLPVNVDRNGSAPPKSPSPEVEILQLLDDPAMQQGKHESLSPEVEILDNQAVLQGNRSRNNTPHRHLSNYHQRKKKAIARSNKTLKKKVLATGEVQLNLFGFKNTTINVTVNGNGKKRRRETVNRSNSEDRD